MAGSPTGLSTTTVPLGQGPAEGRPERIRAQDGVVYHTYSTYARGVEALMGTYQYLDLTPLGQQEEGLDFPQAWWRRHDEHGT